MSSSQSATLMTPTNLGQLRLGNRIAMAPMTRRRALGAVPSESAAVYYAQRATAGLIVSEGICISPGAGATSQIPGLWNDAQVDAWHVVTDAVHAAGGVIVAQLWHMGRAAVPDEFSGHVQPVGPSAVVIDGSTYLARAFAPFEEPRSLDVAEIASIVGDFAIAARHARRAGFDGVELHGANGYLIDQFLHSSSNRRTDGYGSGVDGRTRLLTEVTEALVAEWDSGRVGVRLSPSSSFQDMHDPDLKELFSAALGRLDSLPLAYVHCVEPGISGALTIDGPPAEDGLGCAWVSPRSRHPVIATGNFTAKTGAAALAGGHADVIGFGRSFLANPDLPERLANGWELNTPDRPTFYEGGDVGYTDYSPSALSQVYEHPAPQSFV